MATKSKKNNLNKLNNIELVDKLASSNDKEAVEIKKEILSRMMDSNAETFTLFGVKNNATGKLVSDITNPRHKYWEREKSAHSAISGYTAGFRYRKGTYNKDDLEVVTIKCIVQEKDNE